MTFSNFHFLESGALMSFYLGQSFEFSNRIIQLPLAVLLKAFQGELVDQEAKKYVREVGELGMVAEGDIKIK